MTGTEAYWGYDKVRTMVAPRSLDAGTRLLNDLHTHSHTHTRTGTGVPGYEGSPAVGPGSLTTLPSSPLSILTRPRDQDL